MELPNHGYVIAGKDVPNVKEGTLGTITAYLPEDKTYAVWWNDIIERNNIYWYTYKEESPEEFKKRFKEVVLYLND